MKALVLAAGRSQRMSPVKDKNFLMFLGKSLIQRQLEILARNGFQEIVVAAGAHNLEAMQEMAEQMMSQAEAADLSVTAIEQEDLDMGMCGAVLSAREHIVGGPVMIFSSNDVIDDLAFQQLAKAANGGEAQSYILGKTVDQYFPGGYLETDEQGFIHNIVEKPGAGNEPSNLVNLVAHLHMEPAVLLDYLEKVESDNDDLYEVALAAMMADGVRFKSVAYDGFWQPIKFPWHVQKVADYFFDKEIAVHGGAKIAQSAQIADRATVKGDVIIGENVKIFEGAIVNGPAYIGDNSVIANNALVRSSYLGERCVIGFASEVARSYLGDDVWTHSNYIGDSVIGDNVSFGSGTVTGNLRLDEKDILVNCKGDRISTKSNKFGLITGNNVRVGINTSFMPGCKIGSDTFIGAGIVVAQDVDDGKFVRGQWELKISDNNHAGMKMDRDDMKNNLK